MHIIISSIIYHVILYQILADILLNHVSFLYLLIINIPFNFKIMSYKTSSRVFILHKKKCYTHNYIKHHLPRQMIPDILDITLHFVSYLYLLIINIRFLLSKLWHLKREAGYLFCTGKNGMSIIISSISCQVRWHQIFPYHVSSRQLFVPFDYQYPFFCQNCGI